MSWLQKKIRLRERPRGFHLITRELLSHCPELKRYKVGLLHLFIQHTSASLTINENADPTVLDDFESFFSTTIPNEEYFVHTYEGPDDMPAHLKASLLGASVSLPISNGSLVLGTWQGVYLGEHRDSGGPRDICVTFQGETY